MSNSTDSQQAFTPWSDLCWEVTFLALAVLVPAVSLSIDFQITNHEWFQRSGALMVLFAGILAYRSLTRHYQKFFNNMVRGFPLSTSGNQRIVDFLTLVLSILGTLVWGYGDLVFRFA